MRFYSGIHLIIVDLNFVVDGFKGHVLFEIAYGVGLSYFQMKNSILRLVFAPICPIFVDRDIYHILERRYRLCVCKKWKGCFSNHLFRANAIVTYAKHKQKKRLKFGRINLICQCTLYIIRSNKTILERTDHFVMKV